MGKVIELEEGYKQEILFEIEKVLKNDGVVIMPSDTIMGFLFTEESQDRVRKIKRRDDRPFLYLVDSYERIESIGIKTDPFKSILDNNWPGPFTFLFPFDGKKTGVRIPEWQVLQEVIKTVNKPLLSTSVNYSGEDLYTDINSIIDEFVDKVDIIIYDPGFSCKIASTIIDLSGNKPEVIREGSVKFEP